MPGCNNYLYVSGEVAKLFWAGFGFFLCACVAVAAAFVTVLVVTHETR